MAKKNHLEMTPLMTLSALAIFTMMPIMFTIAKNDNRAKTSSAAEPRVIVVTPTPEATPDAMKY